MDNIHDYIEDDFNYTLKSINRENSDELFGLSLLMYDKDHPDYHKDNTKIAAFCKLGQVLVNYKQETLLFLFHFLKYKPSTKVVNVNEEGEEVQENKLSKFSEKYLEKTVIFDIILQVKEIRVFLVNTIPSQGIRIPMLEGQIEMLKLQFLKKIDEINIDFSCQNIEAVDLTQYPMTMISEKEFVDKKNVTRQHIINKNNKDENTDVLVYRQVMFDDDSHKIKNMVKNTLSLELKNVVYTY